MYLYSSHSIFVSGLESDSILCMFSPTGNASSDCLMYLPSYDCFPLFWWQIPSYFTVLWLTSMYTEGLIFISQTSIWTHTYTLMHKQTHRQSTTIQTHIPPRIYTYVVLSPYNSVVFPYPPADPTISASLNHSWPLEPSSVFYHLRPGVFHIPLRTRNSQLRGWNKRTNE